MIITPGATSQSITIQIVDDSGLAVTGLVAATFPTTSYERVAEALTGITLSDLAAITSAYSSGGVKEVGGGYYRLDVPDAAFATASKVRIIGEATGKHILYPVITCAYIASDVEQWKGSTAPAMTGDAYARLGAPVGASISADVAGVPAALLDLSSGVETSLTLRQAMRLLVAANAGKLSGAATTTITIRDTADAKNRIVATVDSSGNRSALTYDLT